YSFVTGVARAAGERDLTLVQRDRVGSFRQHDPGLAVALEEHDEHAGLTAPRHLHHVARMRLQRSLDGEQLRLSERDGGRKGVGHSRPRTVPPSTAIMVPVMKDARSLARNATSAPSSAGLPIRF